MKLLERVFGLGKKCEDLDRFEVYRVFSNETDAFILKGMLETNGIKCFIEGDTLSSVYPSALTFSGTRLLIMKKDFLMADHLIESQRAFD
ncbi:MAG: DUF2007 domain-containing protein [Muribaculaceae bacterium]|nr:DUF2007 domain-containing protein [Muribaculaceae bacterium]